MTGGTEQGDTARNGPGEPAPDRDRAVGRRGVLRAGGAGVAALAAAPAVAAQEGAETRPDFGDWLAEADGGYRDARGQSEVRVKVGAPGNGGNFAFLPAGLWVDPGTTVVWEWTGKGQQHNVVAEEGGDFESQLTAEEGFTYDQTFEDGGITTYFCDPHKSLEMKGAVAVGDDVPTVAVGGEGGAGITWEWPAGGVGAALFSLVFGGLGLAVASILGAEAYHDWRRKRERSAAASDTEPAPTHTEEAPEAEPAHEIGHDEYDPVGTAALIVVYLAVIVLMWLFMYFVEFLGNGPTVVG